MTRTRISGIVMGVSVTMMVAGATQAPAQRATPGVAVAVLAGGCYWGVESVFRHVRGVTSAVSGFATPVSGGDHAESVRITYDPALLSYHQILEIFFSVVHDPTQRNRQGPDVGPEYRSIVFVNGQAERRMVRAYIDSLAQARTYPRPIVTEVDSPAAFTPVDDTQQDYAAKHPDEPYIVTYDAPKLRALRRAFPALYRE